MDCIFCKIASGEFKSEKVFENERILAFKDINPVAKTHVLVIPKQHIESAAEINSENSAVVSEIFEVIAKLSKELSLEEGFRVVTNIGKHGCQSVSHLHFHIIGSEQLSPKMS